MSVVIAATSCSSDERPTTSAPPSPAPAAVPPIVEAAPVLPVTVTDSTGAEVTITSIERIVPVDGDLAEVVFALGLGDKVVAVDISATYPSDVDALPDIGYQRALNAESVAAVEPTVVLATDLAQPPEVLEQLRNLRIPVVVIEREFSLSGPPNKVRSVADALGVPGRGEALAASMQADIDAAVDEAAVRSAEADPLRIMVVYLRGPSTQLIFGEGTGADVLIEAVGGVDVASDIGVIDNAPITAEALLNAQPDVLVVTTTGLASVGGIDGLLAIGGIARTPAGEQRRILAFEDQFLLGGGPRFAALIASLVDQLYPIEP
jgi:iron complex transport system substrate-binding protein